MFSRILFTLPDEYKHGCTYDDNKAMHDFPHCWNRPCNNLSLALPWCFVTICSSRPLGRWRTEQLAGRAERIFYEKLFVSQLWGVRRIFDLEALSNIHNYIFIISLHPEKATTWAETKASLLFSGGRHRGRQGRRTALPIWTLFFLPEGQTFGFFPLILLHIRN